MSELVEKALGTVSQSALVPLPVFHSGDRLVDVADRAAPVPGHGMPQVLVVDTNILVYAADADSQIHECQKRIHSFLGKPRGAFVYQTLIG